ncbi:MAG: DEAD/DEAH box helicase [Candidatus Lokiarchaeota archaeon]|nr:DEAD/DEAH box helicase [Candidatus Lokiarchaeota archaeon]MBD3340571.1 DEAD/DEAH box helicase [Candidatus Lokiarchaeota archaeon]
MVDFEDFLKYLKTQDYYVNQIAHIEHIPANKAEYGTLNRPLNLRLNHWIKQRKVKLWVHQAKAINYIRSGKNTIIATSTASGKSLCYNLSVLEAILDDPKTTALYIFPTKALARDQYTVLSNFMRETRIKLNRVGVYDGDVEPNDKRKVLDSANVIITNPYGIHFYLPWFKKKWRRVCQNLKYVVLDEIHIYRGIFGSNFAMLVRRLKRLLESYGVRPIWILSSATICNSKKFAEKLVGELFESVEEDGSPSGAKKVILWDLLYNENTGKYFSAHQETKSLFVSHLKKGIQTLLFTLSRKMAELQAIWTRNALPTIKDKIYSYRAGISKKSRREIERKFKNNEILGISSTNALELGIDIGNLSATISSGFPGTISSFKQQIGRSGRGIESSLSTYIPMQNPLDLFYVHNPDVLFGPLQEEILITLDNPYILKNHICCASKEKPIEVQDFEQFSVKDKGTFQHILSEIESEDLLMKRGNKYYWKGAFFPNQKYNLNNLSDRIYKVILRTSEGEFYLTSEDESYVFRDLHQGAVYLYEAESYVVEELDLHQKKVYIAKADLDYYTQSLKHTDITPIEILSESKTGANDVIATGFGNVKVEHEYYSYKVIDTLSQEIRARLPLEDIPIIEFETQAMWFYIPFEYQKALELNDYDLGGSIHALEHALIAMAPALAQISRWDLGGVSIDFDPVRQQPIIYIYDAFRGGIGISESLYHNLIQLMKLAYKLIHSCKCQTSDGCPACVMSPKCGNNNEPLDKKGAFFFLQKLLNVENP